MFPRLIITVILIVAAIAVVRHVRARLSTRNPPVLDAKTARCAHCEVYFPSKEAVVRAGREYCSTAHADASRE